MRAVVIGAGFGGIAAALRLRAKGYEVVLIDRCAQLGGRAQVFEREGFRHDAGPTVITAPFLIAELFTLFAERMEDHLTLVPLTPWYRFYFADGDMFDYGGTLAETLAEIGRIEPADRDGYARLLAHSKRIFDVGFTELSTQSFHRLGTMLAQIPRLLRLRSDKTVWQLVSTYIRNPKLRRAFSIQPLLVGGNPFDTTSIYGLIHYLERAFGVHFVMGGTGAITRELGALMARQQIEVRLGETVRRIRIENGAATGVILDDGREIPASLVVSNADAAHLYTVMVPKVAQARATRLKLAAARYSMGLFVLYFGTRVQYPAVAHHTIWLGERYRELLADIFDRKVLTEDFSLYLHRPTATDPSFAPAGCDSFYVLCPVPNLQADIDWAVEGPRLQDRIVAALDRTILPGLANTITAAFIKTPADFRDDYLSEHGAGFSVAPLFRQSAWFRFHNKAEGIKDLYLTGAGTHPGAGLPGVLCSAKVIDTLIPPANSHPSVGRTMPLHTGAYAAADATLAAKGRSFHWARRLLGPVHATRATRLYGFCRRIDDLADEAQAPDAARTALLGIERSLQNGTSDDPLVADAIALLRECAIDPAIPIALIRGVMSDLDPVRIATEADLLRYCYRVAGTVGLMMSAALDVTDGRALHHAIDLGIAMQLTNICRDVQQDALAGRRYLPASLVGAVEPERLAHPTGDDRAVASTAITRLLDLADTYYRSGEAGLRYLPKDARRGILVAARVYGAIGAALRARRCDYWSSRAVVPTWRKAAISLSALTDWHLRRPFEKPVADHDQNLHRALIGMPGANVGRAFHAT
jgi:phytoene desaturase